MNHELGKLIGRGRTADVYQYTDSAVVKLLRPGFPESILEYEKKIHTAVQSLGLPIPKILDKITIDGRPGLVYQKINGITVIDAVKAHPRNIIKYARDMAALHNDIGSCTPEGLPSLKQRLLSGIARQKILSVHDADRAAGKLESLNNGGALCHCDFHPGNIMTDGGNYRVIDWVNAVSGSFGADVMRTLMILDYAADPNGEVSALLARTAGALIRKTYFKNLLKLSKLTPNEVFSWEVPTIAARFSEDVPASEEAALKKRLKKILF